MPEALPPAGETTEIAWIRWLDDHTRITVGRLAVPVSSPGVLHGVTHLAQAEGWEVRVNETSQHAEPLSFLDACYAGYATFTEAVPELAKLITRTLAAQARYEGWDEDEMDVHLKEAEVGHGTEQEAAPTR